MQMLMEKSTLTVLPSTKPCFTKFYYKKGRDRSDRKVYIYVSKVRCFLAFFFFYPLLMPKVISVIVYMSHMFRNDLTCKI